VSSDENKAVVRRWIEGFNNGDEQAEADARTADYVAHFPGAPPLDSEGWIQATGAFVDAFPDLRLMVEDIMAEGDRVAARVSFRGSHNGPFQGIPPTNKHVTFTSIEMNRMVDGKVAEHWVEIDLLGLLQQLGATPAESPPA